MSTWHGHIKRMRSILYTHMQCTHMPWDHTCTPKKKEQSLTLCLTSLCTASLVYFSNLDVRNIHFSSTYILGVPVQCQKAGFFGGCMRNSSQAPCMHSPYSFIWHRHHVCEWLQRRRRRQQQRLVILLSSRYPFYAEKLSIYGMPERALQDGPPPPPPLHWMLTCSIPVFTAFLGGKICEKWAKISPFFPSIFLMKYLFVLRDMIYMPYYNVLLCEQQALLGYYIHLSCCPFCVVSI